MGYSFILFYNAKFLNPSGFLNYIMGFFKYTRLIEWLGSAGAYPSPIFL